MLCNLQEMELVAVKTKGGLRFVSPSSSKKSSVTPVACAHTAATTSTVSSMPTSTAAPSTGGVKGVRQSAAVAPAPSPAAKVSSDR